MFNLVIGLEMLYILFGALFIGLITSNKPLYAILPIIAGLIVTYYLNKYKKIVGAGLDSLDQLLDAEGRNIGELYDEHKKETKTQEQLSYEISKEIDNIRKTIRKGKE